MRIGLSKDHNRLQGKMCIDTGQSTASEFITEA